jgi:lysocardiolipin and lysophospholipid acyltransferase
VTSTSTALEVDPPEEEREKFDLWLRELWREKDIMIERYYDTGSLVAGSSSGEAALKVPLKLRRKREVLDAFCFFAPGVVIYHLWSRFLSGSS